MKILKCLKGKKSPLKSLDCIVIICLNHFTVLTKSDSIELNEIIKSLKI